MKSSVFLYNVGDRSEVNPNVLPANSASTTQKITSCPPIADGQWVFLSPVNMRMLLHEAEATATPLPTGLHGRLLELEYITQTEASRRRYRALSHLPLGGQCVVGVNPRSLSGLVGSLGLHIKLTSGHKPPSHSPLPQQHFGCVSWTSVIAVPQTLWMHSQKALSSALLGGHGSQNRPLISRVGIPWLLPRLPPEQPTPCHKLLRL